MRNGMLALLLIILIAGCTAEQKDLKEIVKEIPEVKSFLVKHPSAVFDVSLVPQGQLVSQVEAIKIYCPQITLGSYYKVIAADIGSKETFTAWINSKDYTYICSNIVFPTTSTTQTIASTTTTVQAATTTAAPTTTIAQLTTSTIAATTTTASNQTNVTATNQTNATTTTSSSTTTSSTTTSSTTTSSSTTTTTLPQNIFGLSNCAGSNSSGGLGADGKGVSKFELLQHSNISKLISYTDGGGTGSTSQVMKGIIYADSGGNPGALKATTNEVTVLKNQPAGWVDLPFSSPVDLLAGNYWLGTIRGQNTQVMRYYYINQTGILATRGDVYSDGASDPFNNPSLFNLQMCVYATNA